MHIGLKMLRALACSRPAASHEDGAHPGGPTVTISRDFGAGADEVARQLAQRLHVRCWDHEILDEVVKAAGVAPEEVEHLDQHVGGWIDDWIYALSNGRHADRGMYLMHLTRVLHGIAHQGGVVVGRGGYLVLAERRAFRVRITGSPEICALRVARERSMNLEDARRLVEEKRREREAYMRSYFKHEQDAPSDWDLVVNTDKFGMPETVEIVVGAMQAAGHAVPALAG
ncbi:MAG: cytidylate kinase-like family protein [Planctomycetota bacterium]|nr:cytidylate kinase-like family protein [Planctomycetota bacterium]